MLSCSLRRRRHLSLPQQHTIPLLAVCTTQRSGLISGSGGGNQPKVHPNPALLDAAAAAAAAVKTPRFCQSQTPFAAAAATTTPIRRFTAIHNLLPSTCARPTSFFSSPPHPSDTVTTPLGPPAGLGKAYFSSSRAIMGAVKIDGTAIAKRIRENLHAEIQEKKKINPRYAPSLNIIQGMFLFTLQGKARYCIRAVLT